jgi:shikimate kinase
MVYLEVSPDVAATRMGGAARARPLLAGADPAARLGELLREREWAYLQANHTVSVDLLSPGEVAALIVALASA